MKRPIRKVILHDGIKAVVDTIIAFTIFFLWKKFGLAVALPVFIFILVIVAPLVGLERLLLIATVFLGLTVDMAKENKFSEAAIFFWIVVACVVVDEGIRVLKRGLPNLTLQLPEDPYTRNMCFSILGAVIFYTYSF